MVVSELIAILSSFHPEARVVTPGFDESHLDDVVTVCEVYVHFHDDVTPGHVGRHKESEDGEPAVLIDF